MRHSVPIGRKWLLTVLVSLSTLTVAGQGYPVPSVPDSITDATARCDYATARYWDHFDFNDTTLLRTDYGEQALVDFLWLVKYASEKGREQAVDRWVHGMKSSPAAYRYFVGKARQYLTNPDSPVYALIAMERITGNRIGDQAQDFCYVTADGRHRQLSQTATDRLTLLLFYDPDCDNCRNMIARLRTDDVVNKAIAKGQLTVLAIYTEEDYDRWSATLKDMPASWTVATDHAVVTTNELYDLTVMPALYLLDTQKRVVQKDSITAIRQYLNQL